MQNNKLFNQMILSELEIAQERMSFNIILEILKNQKHIHTSYTPLFLGLTVIESSVENAARIRKYDQLIKDNPDIKLNENDLIASIAIGVLIIKFIDDIIKIKYNFRPTEEIEKSGMNFLSSLISIDPRYSLVDSFERIGLKKEMLMDGFKQFLYVSAMLLTDKYLSDNVENKSSSAQIAALAGISSIILISEKELMKRFGNFLAPNVNQQGNDPQIHPIQQADAQVISLQPAHPIDSVETRQQTVSASDSLAEQALPVQQAPSQSSSALTQNLSSPSPRDRSGVSESIVSQTEVRESIASQPSETEQRLTVNTVPAPTITQVQSLRARLAHQSARDS
jgi:hypothetical protein